MTSLHHYPSLVTSFMLSNFNTFQPIDHSIYQSIYLSIYPSIPSIYHIPPSHLSNSSMHASIYLHLCNPSTHPPIHHIYQSIYLSIHYLYLSITSIHPSIHPSHLSHSSIHHIHLSTHLLQAWILAASLKSFRHLPCLFWLPPQPSYQYGAAVSE